MEAITNHPNLKPWKPGQSGNPASKPPGTRHAFSQGFIRDFALVWQEEGLEAVRKVAKKSHCSYFGLLRTVAQRPQHMLKYLTRLHLVGIGQAFPDSSNHFAH